MEKTICRFYKEGRCRYGNKCRFLHTNDDNKSIDNKYKNVDYCSNYNEGHCYNNDRCRLGHSKITDLPFDYHCITYVIRESIKVISYTEKCYTRDGLMFYFYDKNGKKITRSLKLISKLIGSNNFTYMKGMITCYIKHYHTYMYILMSGICKDLVNVIFDIYLLLSSNSIKYYGNGPCTFCYKPIINYSTYGNYEKDNY